MSNIVLQFKPITKACQTCKQELSLTMFGGNAYYKEDGLQKICIDCAKKRQATYRIRNKTKVGVAIKKYREKMTNNQNYRLQCLLNASRQRAALKGREHTLIKQDLVDVYPKDGCCPIFGFKLEWNKSGFRETSPSIDRIDSSKGYTKDNVQIISWKANRIKSYATTEELETVVNYMKLGG